MLLIVQLSSQISKVSFQILGILGILVKLYYAYMVWRKPPKIETRTSSLGVHQLKSWY